MTHDSEGLFAPSYEVSDYAVPTDGARAQLAIETAGDCLRETLDNIEHGVGARPLPRAALERAREQAEDVLSEILRSYAEKVATGEVGVDGTARASEAPPVAGKCPTGLLYGRVQSGKTVAMITLAAMAIDNGFRVVVVFTSNYVKLVEQTTERFRAVEGPMVHASTQIDGWQSDAAHVERNLGEYGLVVVCAKDPRHLLSLQDLLVRIRAERYPALILDDEADQATLDTNTRARSQGKDLDPSTINDRIVSSSESIRGILRHNVFLQVTATPFPLLLQNVDDPMRPEFTRLLEPGAGYTGGESFFSFDHVEPREGIPPLEFVDEDEAEKIDRNLDQVPVGLAHAISFFVLSASAQYALVPESRKGGYNFLCHTSYKTGDHDKLADLIRLYLERLEGDLRSGDKEGETGIRLAWAYEKLKATLPDVPSMGQLRRKLKSRLHKRRIHVVNAVNSKVEFGRELNFIVGGNILGRGLTIDNLLVTYYLRRAQVSQMDTMLQHARMFGYRETLMPFTRVFLPRRLAMRFNAIHVAEHDLRELLRESDQRDRIPVEVVPGLRATRPNVLDAGTLNAYRSGEHVYPLLPVYRRADVGSGYTEQISKLLERLAPGILDEPKIFREVPIDGIVEVVRTLRVDRDDTYKWDKKAIATVLESLASGHGGRGSLYFRAMSRRNGPELPTGGASGREVADARSQDRPVLFMFKDDGRHDCWDGVPFWYPTIVFPPSMANQLFNTTA